VHFSIVISLFFVFLAWIIWKNRFFPVSPSTPAPHKPDENGRT
jgi:hypothetical protein